MQDTENQSHGDSCSADTASQLSQILSELENLKAQNEFLNAEVKALKTAQDRDKIELKNELRHMKLALNNACGSSSVNPNVVETVLLRMDNLESRLVPLEVGCLPAFSSSRGNVSADGSKVSQQAVAMAPPQDNASCWGTDFMNSGCDDHHQQQTHPVQHHPHRGLVESLKSHADISEAELVSLAVNILLEHGAVPVGKMGSMLHRAANNHNLPTILKDRYGGLKKFLLNQDEFIVGTDHPYNPHVRLRGMPETPIFCDANSRKSRRMKRDKRIGEDVDSHSSYHNNNNNNGNGNGNGNGMHHMQHQKQHSHIHQPSPVHHSHSSSLGSIAPASTPSPPLNQHQNNGHQNQSSFGLQNGCSVYTPLYFPAEQRLGNTFIP